MRKPGNEVYRKLIKQIVGGLCCVSITACIVMLTGCASDASISVQRCGTVNARLVQKGQPPAHDAENCLAQAFASCHAATMTFEQYGVDAGATYLITVETGKNGCVIDVQEDDLINTHHATKSYTCLRAQLRPPGLMLMQCTGHDDITITGPSSAVNDSDVVLGDGLARDQKGTQHRASGIDQGKDQVIDARPALGIVDVAG